MSSLSNVMGEKMERSKKEKEDFHANHNSTSLEEISLRRWRQFTPNPRPTSSHTSELMLRLAKRASEFISYL